jgi:hypothetical protein
MGINHKEHLIAVLSLNQVFITILTAFSFFAIVDEGYD